MQPVTDLQVKTSLVPIYLVVKRTIGAETFKGPQAKLLLKQELFDESIGHGTASRK